MPRSIPRPTCCVLGCIRTSTTQEIHVIFTDRYITIQVDLCDKHKGA